MATIKTHIKNIYAALGVDYNKFAPPSEVRGILDWHLSSITALLAEGKLPSPPATGTAALKSVDGVIQWVME
jgi:hypothetical protein